MRQQLDSIKRFALLRRGHQIYGFLHRIPIVQIDRNNRLATLTRDRNSVCGHSQPWSIIAFTIGTSFRGSYDFHSPNVAPIFGNVNIALQVAHGFLAPVRASGVMCIFIPLEWYRTIFLQSELKAIRHIESRECCARVRGLDRTSK